MPWQSESSKFASDTPGISRCQPTQLDAAGMAARVVGAAGGYWSLWRCGELSGDRAYTMRYCWGWG